MENKSSEIKKVLKVVPKDLPFHLGALTTAGHLLAAGYDVQEESLHEDGFPGRTLIFAPVLLGDDDKEKVDGHLNVMFEIRMNILLTIREAAEECGVGYRTIQRWRDENKIPVFYIKRKQFFASEIVKDYAAKRGHIHGRVGRQRRDRCNCKCESG